MANTIAIVGTLDTKGDEVRYVRELIQRRGHRTLVIDTGILGQPPYPPDISREQVAEAAGVELNELASGKDEAGAIHAMALGATRIVRELHSSGNLDGIVALGGSMGSSLAVTVLQSLPLTMPKLLVSAVAFSPLLPGDMVGKDLTLMPTVVDLWGLNRVTKRVLENAAGAIAGMVETHNRAEENRKPLIGVTTLGTASLKYTLWAKPMLEDKGYEVVVFHTNGLGGRVFEQFVEQGLLDGALDLSMAELVNHICGGIMGVESRLHSLAKRAIPRVVAPGALWFVGGPVKSLPPRFKKRKLHPHNSMVTHIEASEQELLKVARAMAQRLNKAIGPTVLLIPSRGFSEPDRPWREYHNPAVRDRFIEALKQGVDSRIELIELDSHINDPEFAQAAVNILQRLMRC